MKHAMQRNPRINLDALAEHIKPRLDQLVPQFIPNAKRMGNQWRIGNLKGEKGNSLMIGDTGFYDHATGDKGSHISLFAAILGKSIVETARHLAGASDYRGLELDDERGIKPVTPSATFGPLVDTHRALLVERGFNNVVDHLPIATASNGSLAFLHNTGVGTLAFAKYYHAPDKRWWSDAGQFNAIPWLLDFVSEGFPDADTLYITEGQWDAIAVTQAGFPAISIPEGANNHHWTESCAEFLKSFDRLVLCYDNDKAGNEALRTMAMKLTRPVFVIDYPSDCKDANDILLKHGLEKLQATLKDIRTYAPPQIINGATLYDQAETGELSLFEWDTPWKDRFQFHMRANESTLITGYTGDGKSTIMRSLIAWAAAHHNATVAVGTFEDTPLRTTAQMRMLLKDHPDPKSVIQRINFIDTSHPDLRGRKPTMKEVLQLFRQLWQRNGCDLFAIDNLMCLKVSREDLGEQAEAANDLRDFTLEIPGHTLMCAHPRKLPSTAAVSKLQPPDINEIRGAGEIADMSFNILAHVRNKPKERELQLKREKFTSKEELARIDVSKPDAILQCQKQRYNGKLPVIWLWRSPEGNFHPDPARTTKWW